jgi:importin-4
MIFRHPSAVPLDRVLPAIVNALPLEDYAENEPTYKVLMELYRAHDQTMISLTPQFVEKLGKVFAGKEDQLKGDTRVKLLELVKVLQTEFPHLFDGQGGLRTV